MGELYKALQREFPLYYYNSQSSRAGAACWHVTSNARLLLDSGVGSLVVGAVARVQRPLQKQYQLHRLRVAPYTASAKTYAKHHTQRQYPPGCGTAGARTRALLGVVLELGWGSTSRRQSMLVGLGRGGTC
eukprot:192529-Rhodomonas_salina.1